jgi:hypothetical protein
VNGSDAMEMEMVDYIPRWAEIKKALSASRREVLKTFKVTEAEFRLMEINAAEQLGDGERMIGEDRVYTTSQTVFMHKNSVPAGATLKIHLQTKQ